MSLRPQGVTIPIPPGRLAHDAQTLRWGVVSTIKAPVLAIARFAAYYLDLGANQIDIYLDHPEAETTAVLAQCPRLNIVQCDDAYWHDKPTKARSTHQMRQAYNASRSYRRANRLNWLAHLDVDEFLLTVQPVATHLAHAPDDAAFLRMRPAELLAQDDPYQGPAHFKLTRQAAGATKSDLAQIYPTYGAYVPEGFLSYTGGKIFARTGLGKLRFGIHSLVQKGNKVTNGPVINDLRVGHAHAPDWDTFMRHFSFRRLHGSYSGKNKQNKMLAGILQLVEGEDGLRQFFDEMCAATPDLLARLSAHDMLHTARLDLDEKVARWFGALPGGTA